MGRIKDGGFVPVGRISADAAAVVAQQLAVPTPASVAPLAKAHIQCIIISKAADPNASLEPLRLAFPFPYPWLLAPLLG